jgi:hypothetical protein
MSTKGRDLIRAQPRARTVVPDGFTLGSVSSSLGHEQPRARTVASGTNRVPSVSRRTLGSPEAQLGQTLSCSDLGRIALPTDRIACAFNAEIA